MTFQICLLSLCLLPHLCRESSSCHMCVLIIFFLRSVVFFFFFFVRELCCLCGELWYGPFRSARCHCRRYRGRSKSFSVIFSDFVIFVASSDHHCYRGRSKCFLNWGSFAKYDDRLSNVAGFSQINFAKLFELVPFSKYCYLSNGVVIWQWLQFLFYSIISLLYVHIFVHESLTKLVEDVCWPVRISEKTIVGGELFFFK
jgi:hypothetical protein